MSSSKDKYQRSVEELGEVDVGAAVLVLVLGLVEGEVVGEGRVVVGGGRVVELVEDQLVPKVLQEVVGEIVALVRRVVAGRRQQRVQRQPQALLHHHRDDAREQRTTDLEAGICIDLDQPGVQFSVEHEVQSEDLEVADPAFAVDAAVVGADDVGGDLAHPGQHVLPEAGLEAGVGGVEVALQFLVGELVGRLVLAVVGRVLLDGVVGEVHEEAAQVLQRERLAAGAHVALGVPVGLERAVADRYQHVMAQVELAALVEQRVRDVGLHDGSFRLAVGVRFALEQPAGHLAGAQDGDAVAAVGALARLDDPDAALGRLLLVLQEERVGLVVRRFEVVGARDHREGVATLHLPVVVLHRVEQRLLGADEGVVRHVVANRTPSRPLHLHLLLDRYLEPLQAPLRPLAPRRRQEQLPVVLPLQLVLHPQLHLPSSSAITLQGCHLLRAAARLQEGQRPDGSPALLGLLARFVVGLRSQFLHRVYLNADSRFALWGLLLRRLLLLPFSLRDQVLVVGLLCCVDLLDRVLSPHELGLRSDLAADLEPEPALEEGDQQAAVVALTHEDLGLGVGEALGEGEVADGQSVGEVDLEEEGEVGVDLAVVSLVMALLPDLLHVVGVLRALLVDQAAFGVLVTLLLPEKGWLRLFLDRVDRHHLQHVWQAGGEPRLNFLDLLPDRALQPQPQVLPARVQRLLLRDHRLQILLREGIGGVLGVWTELVLVGCGPAGFFRPELALELFRVDADEGPLLLAEMIELLLDDVVEALLQAALLLYAPLGILQPLVARLLRPRPLARRAGRTVLPPLQLRPEGVQRLHAHLLQLPALVPPREHEGGDLEDAAVGGVGGVGAVGGLVDLLQAARLAPIEHFGPRASFILHYKIIA